MQSIWQASRWLIRKLFFLITLALATTGVLTLRSGLQRQTCEANGVYSAQFHWDFGQWWHVVTFHVAHLIKGQLVPPLRYFAVSPLQGLPQDLVAAVPVTLKIIGTAFVASLAVGMVLGLLLSLYAPGWLRAPVWGLTTTLNAVPDLVLAGFFDLVVLLIALIRGTGPGQGSVTWQKYIAPSLALTLLVLPYIARLTAAAIDEVSVQQYIRAAVARGIHPVRLLFKHVGKNVLIQVWTALPVVASILVSGAAIIEYVAEVHGAGRAMLIALSRPGDGYESSVYILPLLVVFTLLMALSDAGQRLLNPRLAEVITVAARDDVTEAATWQESLERLRQSWLWTALVELAIRFRAGLAIRFRAGLVNLPHTLRRWGRALKDPVLLAGVLGVAALVAVAVVAPRLAPFDPAWRVPLVEGRQINVPPLPPGNVYRLGTDDLGRDVLSRLVYGTRYALLFAMLVVPARFALAAVAGLLAAFRGGVWEKLTDWLATFFTAAPQVLIPLALIPVVNLVYFDHKANMLFWGVAFVAVPGIPRLASAIRKQALAVMALPFVEGAQALGASTPRMIFRHILPQMAPQLATMLALEVPAVLTLTAILGYFRANPGGVVLDTQTYLPIAPILPEWGSLMQSPMMLILANKWWMWAPFVALFVAVLAFNLLGEGLRRQWSSQTGWRLK